MRISRALLITGVTVIGTALGISSASGQVPDGRSGPPSCVDRQENDHDCARHRSTALQFAADGEYVLIPSTDQVDDISRQFTLEAWIKPAVGLPGGYRSIVSKQMAGTGYMLATNDTPVHFKAEVAGDQVTSSSQPSPDGWQHIAAVWDGLLKIYVNGQIDGVLQTSRPIPNVFPVYIGSSPFGADTTWRGAIDEVRIWAIARTQEQIQSTMNQYLCGDEPGLRAYWSFDEGRGSVLGDSAGHSDGVVVGPEWVNGVDLPRSADCRHDVHR
jgi:hypothetical protein